MDVISFKQNQSNMDMVFEVSDGDTKSFVTVSFKEEKIEIRIKTVDGIYYFRHKLLFYS